MSKNKFKFKFNLEPIKFPSGAKKIEDMTLKDVKYGLTIVECYLNRYDYEKAKKDYMKILIEKIESIEL